MPPTDLLIKLEQAGCTVVLDGDTIRVRGPLTDDLRRAIRAHKPALVALLREQSKPDAQDVAIALPKGQARPQVISNVFCFTCFKQHGKAARYQPHTAAPYTWEGDSNWLELTCTKCGAKCYMRDRWGGGGACLSGGKRE